MALEVNPRTLEEPLLLDDTSLAIVANLVRLKLSSRDLVRLQLVSKEWQTWCSENAMSLWKARKQDATSDWYFPTGLRSQTRNSKPGRIWYGLHHPSEKEHHLPDLEFISDWNIKFVTGASGLLLLHAENWMEDMSAELIVCNPLTKKWRVLPKLDRKWNRQMDRKLQNYICSTLGEDGLYNVAIHMVVDEVSNTYEVVMIKRPRICTYNSQTNQWSSISPEASLEPELNTENFDDLVCISNGSIYSNGRIYLLKEIAKNATYDSGVAAIVYVVESRRWLPVVYTLYDRAMYRCMFGEGQPRGPTLVACLGDVYAIVPIIENRKTITRRFSRRDLHKYEIGTVRFKVFKLQEEKKFAFSATLPLKVKLHNIQRFDPWRIYAKRPWSWYRCAAKGAVIWLACEDQLLQFDVVTQRCQTKTVQLEAIRGDHFMAYEPNFYVNP